MSSAINAVTSGTSPIATGSSSIASIGKDQFLKLLVTQLKNQDPMSPMQPNEFAAQLAQFSSVEQLVQLNDSVGAQSTAVQMSTLAGQASLGASIIGRQVVCEGNQVSIPDTGLAQVRVDVGGSGGKAELTLTDSSGKVVATRDLGTVKGGVQTLDLPNDLPKGDYTYALKVKSGDNTVTVTTYTTGVVDAVEFDGGKIMLRLGGLKVSLGSVAQIESAPTKP
jgi:flagellar basal-body rod modification protein FlgD